MSGTRTTAAALTAIIVAASPVAMARVVETILFLVSSMSPSFYLNAMRKRDRRPGCNKQQLSYRLSSRINWHEIRFTFVQVMKTARAIRREKTLCKNSIFQSTSTRRKKGSGTQCSVRKRIGNGQKHSRRALTMLEIGIKAVKLYSLLLKKKAQCLA